MTPRPSTPAHLAGLPEGAVSSPDVRLSPPGSSPVAGGADFDGVPTIPEHVDEFAPRKAGRPKAKKEVIPTHFVT